MTIKIEIIKTASGWNYRNSESRKLVGTVKQCADKPEVYMYETFGDWSFNNRDKAHQSLQRALTKKASELGAEIEFTNI